MHPTGMLFWFCTVISPREMTFQLASWTNEVTWQTWLNWSLCALVSLCDWHLMIDQLITIQYTDNIYVVVSCCYFSAEVTVLTYRLINLSAIIIPIFTFRIRSLRGGGDVFSSVCLSVYLLTGGFPVIIRDLSDLFKFVNLRSFSSGTTLPLTHGHPSLGLILLQAY